MSNNENSRSSERYGLLNAVPCARWGSVFYHGPCPRASVSRPGICVDAGFNRCNLPANRGGRCAHVCCDADCLVDLTKALAIEDDCRCCRCCCCRRRGGAAAEVCSERECRIRCRREAGDLGEDRGDLDCCSRRCRCHRPPADDVLDESNGCGCGCRCRCRPRPRPRPFEAEAENDDDVRAYERTYERDYEQDYEQEEYDDDDNDE